MLSAAQIISGPLSKGPWAAWSMIHAVGRGWWHPPLGNEKTGGPQLFWMGGKAGMEGSRRRDRRALAVFRQHDQMAGRRTAAERYPTIH